MNTANDSKVAVVIGVGPGTGEALARRFTADGYRVALLARSGDTIEPLARELGGVAVRCDVGVPDDLRRALGETRAQLGPVQVLLYNAGSGTFGTLDQVDEAELEQSWRVNVLGLFTAVKMLRPDLVSNRGAVVVTGATASRRGVPFTTAFAQAKMGQRALCESLARTLWKERVHVALVVVDGVINLPRTRARMKDKPDEFFVEPQAIALTAAHLVRQPPSAWTFELEVRPFGETW